jgi:hypothetical protein
VNREAGKRKQTLKKLKKEQQKGRGSDSNSGERE